jgi:hypothetical protein
MQAQMLNRAWSFALFRHRPLWFNKALGMNKEKFRFVSAPETPEAFEGRWTESLTRLIQNENLEVKVKLILVNAGARPNFEFLRNLVKLSNLDLLTEVNFTADAWTTLLEQSLLSGKFYRPYDLDSLISAGANSQEALDNVLRRTMTENRDRLPYMVDMFMSRWFGQGAYDPRIYADEALLQAINEDKIEIVEKLLVGGARAKTLKAEDLMNLAPEFTALLLTKGEFKITNGKLRQKLFDRLVENGQSLAADHLLEEYKNSIRVQQGLVQKVAQSGDARTLAVLLNRVDFSSGQIAKWLKMCNLQGRRTRLRIRLDQDGLYATQHWDKPSVY